jgi:hypothetical protein
MNFPRYPPALVLSVILFGAIAPQPTKADSSRVTCQKAKYPEKNREIPATMIQNTAGNLEPFIYWVEEVAGEKPLERCEQVSEIIQARFDDKTWSRFFLRTGTSIDKYPIICFVSEPKDKACDPERELIVKLKRGENAKKVLDKMLALRYKTDLKLTGEFRFYYGETHREVYIDVDKFLEAVERSRAERQ